MIKYTLAFLCVAFSFCSANAQAPARQTQQQQATKQHTNQLSMRAKLSFPISGDVPEDVVWKRDVYREINLMDNANGGLYYPVEPQGSQMNLFTYIFKLMMTGNIKAYEYRLDGNEVFSDTAKIKPLAFLDNYHIYYERTGKGIKIDDSDIPSREVKSYYLKETNYFDQNTGTFHRKVLALCPIMKREDDFGDAATPYPLFWVRYEDLAPFLAKQTLMVSNLNNAAVLSVDDYFTKSMYKGKIYKTVNMQGLTISQYCKTDSAVVKEQKRIEAEIEAFEKNLWNKEIKAEKTDSVGVTDKKSTRISIKKNKRASVSKTQKVEKSAPKVSSESDSNASPARVSVRRQRHIVSY